ncbi:MAG: aldehyde dehydrogenase family protein, partial [Phycisphaerae bacterium]|nr:aldehyde dehydrogenase family protein [Phycisphaerae bacterium]
MTPAQAIAATRSVAPIWSAFPIADREAAARRFAEIVSKRRADWVAAICRETGKPRWESNTEVDSIIAKVAISIESRAARRSFSSHSESGITSGVRYKPLGVAIVLGPFNFPGHLPNGHVVPALLAGNCVVFKPSEHCPLVGELMNQCWHAAGIPFGTFNLVQGGRSVGEQLIADPRI